MKKRFWQLSQKGKEIFRLLRKIPLPVHRSWGLAARLEHPRIKNGQRRKQKKS